MAPGRTSTRVQAQAQQQLVVVEDSGKPYKRHRSASAPRTPAVQVWTAKRLRGEAWQIWQCRRRFLAMLSQTAGDDDKYAEFTNSEAGSRRDVAKIMTSLHLNKMMFRSDERGLQQSLSLTKVALLANALEEGGELDRMTNGLASVFYSKARTAAELIYQAESHALQGWTNDLVAKDVGTRSTRRTIYLLDDIARGKEPFQTWNCFQATHRIISVENGASVKTFRDELVQDFVLIEKFPEAARDDLKDVLKGAAYAGLREKYSKLVTKATSSFKADSTCYDKRRAHPVCGKPEHRLLEHHEYIAARGRLLQIESEIANKEPVSEADASFFKLHCVQHRFDALLGRASTAFLEAFEALMDDDGGFIFGNAYAERNGLFVISSQPASKPEFAFLDETKERTNVLLRVVHDLLAFHDNRLRDRQFVEVLEGESSDLFAREMKKRSFSENSLDSQTRIASAAITIVVDNLLVACMQREKLFAGDAPRATYEKNRRALEKEFFVHRGERNSNKLCAYSCKKHSQAGGSGSGDLLAQKRATAMTIVDDSRRRRTLGTLSSVQSDAAERQCSQVALIVTGDGPRIADDGALENVKGLENIRQALKIEWVQPAHRPSKEFLRAFLNSTVETLRNYHDQIERRIKAIETVEKEYGRHFEDIEEARMGSAACELLTDLDAVRCESDADVVKLAYKRATAGQPRNIVQRLYGLPHDFQTRVISYRKKQAEFAELLALLKRYALAINNCQRTKVFFDWCPMIEVYLESITQTCTLSNGEFVCFQTASTNNQEYQMCRRPSTIAQLVNGYFDVRREFDENFCKTISINFAHACESSGLLTKGGERWTAKSASVHSSIHTIIHMLNFSLLRGAILVTSDRALHDAFSRGVADECSSFMFSLLDAIAPDGTFFTDMQASGALEKFAFKNQEAYDTALVVHMCALNSISKRRVVEGQEVTMALFEMESPKVEELFVHVRCFPGATLSRIEENRESAGSSFDRVLRSAKQCFPSDFDWAMDEFDLSSVERVRTLSTYAPVLLSGNGGFLPYAVSQPRASPSEMAWSTTLEIVEHKELFLNSIYKFCAGNASISRLSPRSFDADKGEVEEEIVLSEKKRGKLRAKA
jgi:hypothetical protein